MPPKKKQQQQQQKKKKQQPPKVTSTVIDPRRLFANNSGQSTIVYSNFPKTGRPYDFLTGALKAQPNLNPLRIPYNSYGAIDSEGYQRYVQEVAQADARNPNWRTAMDHDQNAPQKPDEYFPPQEMNTNEDDPIPTQPAEMQGVDLPDDAFEQQMEPEPEPAGPEEVMMQRMASPPVPEEGEARPMMRGADVIPQQADDQAAHETNNSIGDGSFDPRVRVIRRPRPPVTVAPSRTGVDWLPDWTERRRDYYEYLSRQRAAPRQRGVTYVDDLASGMYALPQ